MKNRMSKAKSRELLFFSEALTTRTLGKCETRGLPAY